jgi:hypothetical protein
LSPLILKLVRLYGARALRILNKRYAGKPKIPAPNWTSNNNPKGWLEHMNRVGGKKSSHLLKEAKVIQKKYPNLFRSTDKDINLSDAHKVVRVLRDKHSYGHIYRKHGYKEGLKKIKENVRNYPQYFSKKKI